MTVVVSLLRAVNVGGRNKMRMEDLRTLYQSLGFGSVQTFIQSGNVVFTTTAKDVSKLAQKIEDQIETGFGFRPSVINRTHAELKSVIAGSPFASRPGIEPAKLVVTFLAAHPEPQVRDKLAALPPNPEELHLLDRELHIYFPTGMGQSKLPIAKIERILATPGTGRNWNTVLKLQEMAEALESPRK